LNSKSSITRVVSFAMLVLAGSITGAALSAPQDYRFEAVQNAIKTGAEAEIAVRLVHLPSRKLVANAVIFQTRLDMSPMGMKDMTARTAPQPALEPGLYAFRASLTMAGDWMLHLAAKVPGETETVRGSVLIKAVK
jgi:hypothetical protein